jgi:hypothetical protein
VYSTRRIDPRLVYAKTEAGVKEITARTLGLSQSARRVLILLDGKRALSQLPGFVRPGDLANIVDQLETQNLVSLVGISDTAPGDHNIEAEQLSKLKPKFKEMFNRELGPVGRVFDARVYDAVTMDVMRTALREGIDYIKEFADPNTARRLVDYVRAVLNA